MKQASFLPFGDLAVIGDGYDLLLQRLCCVYYTSDPNLVAARYGAGEMVAFFESITPLRRNRIRWWQIERDGHRHYVCVDPAHAGFRTEPPADANTYIEFLPDHKTELILPGIARAVLAAREHRRRSDDPHVRTMLAAVRSAAEGRGARDPGAFADRLREYSESIRHGRYRSRDEMQRAVDSVYEHGLFGCEVGCTEFSASIGLFELQAEANLWIEQPWHDRPHDYLRSVLHQLLLPDTAIISVASHHFAAGRTAMQRAFETSSMWSFQRDVYLALHHFWVANYIAVNTTIALPFSRIVADESLTCAVTGIGGGLGSFFGRSFIEIGRDLATGLTQSGTAAERNFLHHNCSAFFPVMPRPIAQTLLAFARVLARPPAAGRVTELETIAAAAEGASETRLGGGAFTSFVRDYLLLNAARHLELEKEAQSYAARVMGRLLADRALA